MTTLAEDMRWKPDPADPRPLYAQVKAWVRDRISAGELVAGAALPDRDRLARSLGISDMTVRRALIELADEGVLHRIRGKGTFVSPTTGRGASPAIAAPVGLRIAVVSPLDLSHHRQSPFYEQLLQGMLRAAAAEGGFVTVRTATPPFASIGEHLRRHPAPTAIAVVGAWQPDLIEAVVAVGRPTVLVDSVAPASLPDLDEANHHDEPSACEAVAELLRLGHRRIAVLTSGLNVSFFAQRLAGYRRAHLEAGVAVDESLVRTDVVPWSQAGYTAGRALLNQRPDVSALFCGTDEIAIGALAAARDAGRRVPEDVSVVGFGDIGLFSSPALSSVRIPTEAIGMEAVRALVRRLADPTACPSKRIFACEWIARGSIGFAPVATSP